MDARIFSESDYVSPELVKLSPSKKGVVIGEITSEEVDFKGKKSMKLNIPIEIDGRRKTYRPNKDSIKNIAQICGFETKGWLGKTLAFNIITVLGKECVLAAVVK